MKRLISLGLVFCVTSLMLTAQNRMSYSLEFVAGVGVDNGPLVTFSPEFVAQYNWGGFIIGAGAGARYARPCYEYNPRSIRCIDKLLDKTLILQHNLRKLRCSEIRHILRANSTNCITALNWTYCKIVHRDNL